MLRTAICLAVAVVFALLILPVILILKIITIFRPGLELNGIMGFLARTLIPPLLKIAGIRFEVSGQENLPEVPASGSAASAAPGAMFVGNHQGGFDALVPILYLGKTKSVVLKKEIAKIPLAGFALKLFGCIFLDRSSLKAQVSCIHQMEARLREGRDLTLFPEGTRSKGPNMGDFKAGAFRAAIAAGAPVVPFVIDGSWRSYEEHSRLTPSTIQVSILPPVSTGGLTSADAKDLAGRVREIMQQEQFRLRAEKGNSHA